MAETLYYYLMQFEEEREQKAEQIIENMSVSSENYMESVNELKSLYSL